MILDALTIVGVVCAAALVWLLLLMCKSQGCN
jgi:hypothetical protein